ncbi:MAG: BlaI/MecI/CopY family transcriptional regulator [Bryobacteraceae bacterium]
MTIPPPLELACLRILWDLGEGSVREVRTEICKEKPLAYTTVMTVLDRLAARGAVDRRKQGRAFVYIPVLDRREARAAAVRQLVDRYFGGSIEELQAYLEGPEPTGAKQTAPAATALDAALL